MSLKSVLKPDSSVMVGLAEAAAVYVIYQALLPNHSDISAAPAHDSTVETQRKKAAWSAAGVLGFIFLLTRDLNSFLIGGLALTGIDISAKHSNGVNPATGKLQAAPGSAITSSPGPQDNSEAFPLADYSDSDQAVSY
ncbi:MAG: hypothetical protein ACLP5E_22750 [Streptosporangiaceae bacterium]